MIVGEPEPEPDRGSERVPVGAFAAEVVAVLTFPRSVLSVSSTDTRSVLSSAFPAPRRDDLDKDKLSLSAFLLVRACAGRHEACGNEICAAGAHQTAE
eukprot:3234206-Rhodomonas_salina.2